MNYETKAKGPSTGSGPLKRCTELLSYMEPVLNEHWTIFKSQGEPCSLRMSLFLLREGSQKWSLALVLWNVGSQSPEVSPTWLSKHELRKATDTLACRVGSA
ncbi:uncharacterized protein LOC121822746 [Peromyscus maniculatus bairdii]|uniref:uncharacterized protein LOC121822746 n=1 Tax=Peromyscus maniculatus bairdii TaxID=230844 RepID=UPI003FD01B3D